MKSTSVAAFNPDDTAHLQILTKLNITDDQLEKVATCSIITPYYKLIKNNNTISIQWKYDESATVYYYNNPWQNNKIYKVTDTELLYIIDNHLWYANYDNKCPKMIINEAYGTINYSEIYRKIIIYADESDPPDYLLIIPLDDIINEPLINVYKDERTRFKGKFFIMGISDWSNDFYATDKNVYIIEEQSERVNKIDIQTHNITTYEFEPINTADITYNYTFGKEVDDGIIINLTDSDAPDDDDVLNTIKITFF
jgi:hypothetical protein